MTDVPFPSILSKLDAVNDSLTVKRVFGDPYEVDGSTIIPVAAVRGGGGGGGGGGTDATAEQSGSGAGVGFGIDARPLGVVVITEGVASWTPTVDVTRIVLGGQLVALAAVIVIGGVLRRRSRRHHLL
jgi:uncharacterized spore protein YtfJ